MYTKIVGILGGEQSKEPSEGAPVAEVTEKKETENKEATGNSQSNPEDNEDGLEEQPQPQGSQKRKRSARAPEKSAKRAKK
ncbi:uncharacterized protein [Drosophila kikkawai]|uniref:Uncharacterized protein n=1 Tax=Drosophila kikkawai TaxID=30033 RepID=A0A6P4II93_DROKI|nr:uncharacterized protein LOC108079000 [Drosophila kikkawai]